MPVQGKYPADAPHRCKCLTKAGQSGIPIAQLGLHDLLLLKHGMPKHPGILQEVSTKLSKNKCDARKATRYRQSAGNPTSKSPSGGSQLYGRIQVRQRRKFRNLKVFQLRRQELTIGLRISKLNPFSICFCERLKSRELMRFAIRSVTRCCPCLVCQCDWFAVETDHGFVCPVVGSLASDLRY